MKKVLSVLLTMALCFSLIACGGSTNTSTDEKYPWGLVKEPMDAGENAYFYKTLCYDDQSYETIGYVMVDDYSVVPSAEKDGYVEKTVDMTFSFKDENARAYGMMMYVIFGDRISTEFDNIGEDDEFEVNFNGQNYTAKVLYDEYNNNGWYNGVFTSNYRLSVLVPEGYDELIIACVNRKNVNPNLDEDEFIVDGTPYERLTDEDTQWFVLGGKPGEDEWVGSYTPTYNGEKYLTGIGDAPKELAVKSDYIWDPDGEAPPPMIYENTEDNEDEEIIVDINDGKSLSVEITGCAVDKIDKTIGFQPVNVFYQVHGASYDYEIRFRAVDEDIIQDMQFPLKSDTGSVGFDIIGTEVFCDSVVFEVAILDKEGTVLAEDAIMVPAE